MQYCCILLVLLLQSASLLCHAKVVSGNFKLSGVHTEIVLGSFAVTPGGSRLKVRFTSPTPYDMESSLRLRMYRDTEWPEFSRRQLCTEKVQLAKQSAPLNFREVNGKWQADVSMEIHNILAESDDPQRERKLSDNPRNHYWYFVIDDCSLEQYFRDNRIPLIHYELTVTNFQLDPHTKRRHRYRVTHLSGDDEPLVRGHLFTMCLSFLVCLRLFINIVRRLRDKHHSIHAAVLWVMAAAALDSFTSFLELLHLAMYHQNGVGFYFVDCLAAHCEAITDVLLILLLLSIAAGWTLPSSVVTVVTTNANPVQKILAGLAHPITSQHQHPGGSMAKYLAGTILALHLILAQWGRVYNDDFESYHDLEHGPGRILMWTRVALGLLFAAAIQQTSTKFTGSLSKFYTVFALTGFFWFQSLPILTWLCHWVVPYHVRKPTVFVGAAVLQSTSLLLLAWLVTTHSTAYHQVSRMTATTDTLSDSLDRAVDHAPTGSWKLGRKVKVALD